MRRPRTSELLQRLADEAKRHLKALKVRYPALKATVVLASRLGQVAADASPAGILKEFPELFLASEHRSKAIGFAHALDKARGSAADELAASLAESVDRLVVAPDITIELRFDELNYELIWKLQKDDEVDQVLTPRTRSSIRVVLGGLRY